MAERLRKELVLRGERAESLGRSAVEAIQLGYYLTDGGKVDWSHDLAAARAAKVSVPPGSELPSPPGWTFAEMVVQVANESTLSAGYRLTSAGHRPLALNFANGAETGGGFLRGATAQEEALCRSSGLYTTLHEDPMYAHHRDHELWAEASEWAILSPDVPIFRDETGNELGQTWKLSFLTCAAPYAPAVGQPRSRELLRARIDRVLEIARAYGYTTLVLGAWGCGAFENRPGDTARDFREALEGRFGGAFSHVVFAIADWSPERRTLGPFRDTFS